MLIRLKVHPGANRSRALKKNDTAFELWVKAPAERGLANEACLLLLSSEIKVPRERLRLVRGVRSASKTVEVASC